MQKFLIAASIAGLALAGCAIVPTPLKGTDFATLTPRQAAANDSHGERVRWGGEIIHVDPQASSTCFEVLSRELNANARPIRDSESGGRFIACGNGFYDPKLYAEGRQLSVVGRTAGTEKRKIGGYDYTYARADADQVYLWPRHRYNPNRCVPGPYYDPFFGPYPYWWGGWWTPPPVVIVPSHPSKH